MNNLTPFQKALLNSVTEEYTALPTEMPLTDITPVRKRRSSLRRCLIAAAAVLVLVGSVFAAVHFSLQAEVTKTTYELPEFEQSNDNYAISFKESIAAENAPDQIEVYMLPSALVSTENLDASYCYLEDSGRVYYPNSEYTEDNQPIDENVQTVHLEWRVNEHQVAFTQQIAKDILPGDTVLNYQTSADGMEKVSYDTFILGEYEIFCMKADFSAYEEFADEECPVSRMWFWTDGSYLYRLTCGIGISNEEMQQIFDSIAPVEDIGTYLAAAAE